jgi:hypothetical protein
MCTATSLLSFSVLMYSCADLSTVQLSKVYVGAVPEDVASNSSEAEGLPELQMLQVSRASYSDSLSLSQQLVNTCRPYA